MLHLVQDEMRLALRQMLRRPGLYTVAIGSLACAIGFNTAAFSVVNAVLLQPLPYGAASDVVHLWNQLDEDPQAAVSAPEYLDYRREVTALEDLAAYREADVTLTGGADPEQIAAARVTPNFFSVIRREPLIGRPFNADEAAQSGSGVVLIGEGLWKRRFGSDPSILGREMLVDETAMTIIGVLPDDVMLPVDLESVQGRTEVWLPLVFSTEDLERRGLRQLQAIGRIGSGSSLETVNEQLRSVTGRWTGEGRSSSAHLGAAVERVDEALREGLRAPLAALMMAVGVLFLVAIVNVTNLLLVRSQERRSEMAVRAALGAGRKRLLQQLTFEGLTLALISGAVGICMAGLTIEAILSSAPPNIPRLDTVTLDGSALIFALTLTSVTAVVVGIIPGLRVAQSNLASPIRTGSRGVTSDRGVVRIGRILAGAQLAFSVVLLVGAGLLVQSLIELRSVDLGFRPAGVLTMRVSPPATRYADNESVSRFYENAIQRLQQEPTIRTAGATAFVPLSQTVGDWGIDIQGKERPVGGRVFGYLQVVTPGYFETLRYGLEEGRFLSDLDRTEGLPAVVINRRMAEMYWPGENVLGEQIRVRGFEGEWFNVVGIISNDRHNGITEEIRPEMFFPHSQLGRAIGGGTVRSMTLVLSTEAAPLQAAEPARRAIQELDPSLAISDLRPMTAIVDEALAVPRFSAFLLALFAAVAATLGVVGLHAVIAYSVGRRIREFGLRMALGADAREIVEMELSNGGRIVLGGVSTGLLLAFFGTRVLSSMLYRVSPVDILTFTIVGVAVCATCVFAIAGPALRAARVNPAVALMES